MLGDFIEFLLKAPQSGDSSGGYSATLMGRLHAG
jgi:hypothetical protein